MQRLMPALMTGLVAACACVGASAGDVYQWKDAKGITHYSNTPPASGSYKTRVVHSEDTPAAAPAAATASAVPEPAPAASPAAGTMPADDAGCATARKNVAMLEGAAPVKFDSDGDGKLDKLLSPEERAKHLQQIQAALKSNCPQAPAGK